MKELKSVIMRAQVGNLDAFDTIVRRFQDMAVGYAYSILGDFHLAEDAAQEAFIRAYCDLSKLRQPEAFSAWFRKIIFKHCDRLTRGKSLGTVPLEEAVEMPSKDKDPAEAVEEREMKKLVLKSVKSLPQKERMVTVLFYISGYSHQEIAEFLGLPLTTVNHRLRSSRKHLKEKMLDMMKDGLLEEASYEGSPSQEDSPIAVEPISCDRPSVSVDMPLELTESKDSAEEQLITMIKAALREEAPSKDDSFVIAVSICNAAQVGDMERLRTILEA